MMRTRHRAALLLCIAMTTLVGAGTAGDTAPKSTKAKAAVRKYDRAVEKAKADYDRAVAAAAKTLGTELDEALKVALKSGSLDEANRIKGAKESRVKGDVAPRDFTLDGKWTLVYGNGIRRTYTIRGQNLIAEGDKRREGSLRLVDGAILADTGDETVERLTPAGGRFFVEHFNPRASFPDGPPDEYAVATRAE